MPKNKQKHYDPFNRKFWRRLAKTLVALLKEDANQGKLAGGTYSYINSDGRKLPYSAYKGNDMRRFTDGNRLSGYKGVKIKSRRSDSVDMTLTGGMWRRLKVKNVTAKGADIQFDPTDSDKILGAEKYGRQLVGISRDNLEILFDVITEEFSMSVDQFANTVTEWEITL